VLDPAFREVSGKAEIRTASPAWATFRVRTRPADNGHHQIAWPEAAYIPSDLNHFSENFVPENQVIRSRRRTPVFE